MAVSNNELSNPQHFVLNHQIDDFTFTVCVSSAKYWHQLIRASPNPLDISVHLVNYTEGCQLICIQDTHCWLTSDFETPVKRMAIIGWGQKLCDNPYIWQFWQWQLCDEHAAWVNANIALSCWEVTFEIQNQLPGARKQLASFNRVKAKC